MEGHFNPPVNSTETPYHLPAVSEWETAIAGVHIWDQTREP
jgi:hypothetical protein